MHRLLFAPLLLPLLATMACGGPTTAEPEPQPEPEPNAAPYEGPTIVVTLEGDDEQLSTAARARILLYGFDSGIADQSADLIATGNRVIDEFPSTVDIDVPDDPHHLITGSSPTIQQARFYLVVYVDNDGDGQICPGDYTQNYDVLTEPVSFNMGELEFVTIPVRQSDGACRVMP